MFACQAVFSPVCLGKGLLRGGGRWDWDWDWSKSEGTRVEPYSHGLRVFQPSLLSTPTLMCNSYFFQSLLTSCLSFFLDVGNEYFSSSSLSSL